MNNFLRILIDLKMQFQSFEFAKLYREKITKELAENTSRRISETRNESGIALPMIIVMFTVIITIAVAVSQLAFASYLSANDGRMDTSAQFAADAGLDYSILQLNNNETWTGTLEEEPDAEIDISTINNIRSSFETTVVDGVNSNKFVTSTGRIYFPASSTTPISERTIVLELDVLKSGNFSVIAGVGGLITENSAVVLGGTIHVNGKVELNNTSQIGVTGFPVTLSVAHQNCPIPANVSFPQLCTSGEDGEPITVNHPARIYGDVYANNQTNGARMVNDGLHINQDNDMDANNIVEPIIMPFRDRSAIQASMTQTIDNSAAECGPGNPTRTWSAGTKITGNVRLTQSCEVTIEGDVWITGDFEMRNTSVILVAEGVSPTIMVDGNKVDLSNSAEILPNSTSDGVEILNYYSTAACSPDCADVTGVDLKNSQNVQTITMRNASSAPGSVFYSRWTKVSLQNTGQIGAAAGQTIHLS
jgi:hypothetical protein